MAHWSEIDFLPPRYREQHVQRKNFYWRVVVLVAYLALLAVGSVAQRSRMTRLQSDLARAKQELTQAQLLEVQVTHAQQQLSRQRAAAELITYLQHPWPRSQVLAAILPRVPESIHLTELRLYPLAEKAAAAPFWQRQSPGKKEKDAPPPLPATADLQRLLEERNRMLTVVQLNGVAQNQASLHQFLQQLAQDELFAAVELLSIESQRSENNPAGCVFEVCLELKPGYGERRPPQRSTAGAGHSQQVSLAGAGHPQREAMANEADLSVHLASCRILTAAISQRGVQ